MASSSDILISLHEQHANNVFAGKKTVEIRRRCPRIAPGTRVWIYATLPRGAVLGFATVAAVVSKTPGALWKNYRSELAINKSTFDRYLRNCDTAHAVLLRDAIALPKEISLEQMRFIDEAFHPPQFFTRLNGLAARMEAYHDNEAQ